MSKLKKVNSILHDVSLINFPLIGKLILRYRFISILVPLLSVLGTFYVYKSQRNIYSMTVSFANVSVKDSTPSNAIAALIGEDKSGLTDEDVLSITSDWAFHQKIADQLYENDDFFKLNFNSLTSSEMKSTQELISHCRGQKDCIVSWLRNTLPQFYLIKKGPASGKYELVVKTLDRTTTNELLKLGKNTIEAERIRASKEAITRVLKVSEGLVDKKKNEIKDKGGSELLRDKDRLSIEMEDKKTKIAGIEKSIFETKMKLNTLKLQMQEAKKLETIALDSNYRIKFEKHEELKENILKLRRNIHLLSQVPDKDQTDTDKNILKNLKSKLKEYTIELKKLGKTERSVATLDRFVEHKDNESRNVEYEYNITKQQLDKLYKERDKLKQELEEFIEKASKVEETAINLKPDIEYLKLLTTKIVSYRLLESTVTSDLAFDPVSPDTSVYKRASRVKLSLFGFVIGLFSLLILLFVRYVFDDRIYGENEIEMYFEDLEIIGNTPDFEKY